MIYRQAEGLHNFLMTSATQKARKPRPTVLGCMSYSGGKGSSLVFCLGGEKFSCYMLDYPTAAAEGQRWKQRVAWSDLRWSRVSSQREHFVTDRMSMGKMGCGPL